MRHYLTRKNHRIWFLPLLLSLCLMSAGCDSGNSEDDSPNIDKPSSLVGTWNLVSMSDKSGSLFDLPGQTLQAGQPLSIQIDIGGGQSVKASILITGVLTLQTSRYTMDMSTAFTVTGHPTETESTTDTGTWSVSGTTMTILSDDPTDGGAQSMSIAINGKMMTLEDAEARIQFEKR